MQRELVLASASPQRRELLTSLGLPFRVRVSRVAETAVSERDPVVRARMLAHLKAEDVGASFPGAWIIGCDTLVVASNGTLLEKPRSAEEARAMISLQSGTVSTVHSGLCVLTPERRAFEDVSSSAVHFKKLSVKEVDWWVRGGFWKERSGGFQIDGPGQLIIAHISGDWSSVVGLPLFLLGKLMQEAGWDLLSPLPS
jgi:septum formation protein